MTPTETNPRVDRSTALEILAGLEFDPELPCEHVGHDDPERTWHQGPGELLIQRQPVACPCGFTPTPSRHLLCRSAWVYAGQNGLLCPSCHRNHPRDFWWMLAGSVK